MLNSQLRIDSAEEFMLIHGLGRERLVDRVVLWFSVKSPQSDIFCPLGDDREYLSLFSTHQSLNVLLTEAFSTPATHYRPQSEH